ncbi:membrane hypothetical protein [uncultured Desulfatiglans sp.]|uniref:Major facilitator superfamily (MFS) profile domain-containing protein n=1 Tax=Uncultured Desulfatiglans sp. TaxID=1748965 RepID=A0A653A2N1_UNCDX|nr:membrane hypothetical protein [uncultured Desulfatiglans sp.]
MAFPFRIFLTLFSSVFVTTMGAGLVAPLLPVYAHELGAEALEVGLIFGSFSLTRSLFVPYFGKWSDRRGRKPFIVIGLFGYFLVSLAFAAMEGVWSLIAIRLAQGFASAMVLPVAQAYVGIIRPEHEEGRIMADENPCASLNSIRVQMSFEAGAGVFIRHDPAGGPGLCRRLDPYRLGRPDDGGVQCRPLLRFERGPGARRGAQGFGGHRCVLPQHGGACLVWFSVEPGSPAARDEKPDEGRCRREIGIQAPGWTRVSGPSEDPGGARAFPVQGDLYDRDRHHLDLSAAWRGDPPWAFELRHRFRRHGERARRRPLPGPHGLPCRPDRQRAHGRYRWGDGHRGDALFERGLDLLGACPGQRPLRSGRRGRLPAGDGPGGDRRSFGAGDGKPDGGLGIGAQPRHARRACAGGIFHRLGCF